MLQATLLKDLEFSATSANLPAAATLWLGPLSILVICRFMQVRMLKPLLIIFFLSTGAMGGIVVLVLLFLPREVVLVALLAYGAMWGCAKGVLISCLWEVVGRGISEKRRGQVFALAFGAISDVLRKHNKSFGYQMSFLAAILVLAATFFLVLTMLPQQPRPPAESEPSEQPQAH